jgi:hypothetical protein
MACAAARAWNRGARRQQGAADWEKCEKLTTAHEVNHFSRKPESFIRETLPHAPETPQEIPFDGHLGLRQPSLWHGGPGPQVIQFVCRILGAKRAGCESPHAIACHLGAAAEDKRLIFKPMQRQRGAPRVA